MDPFKDLKQLSTLIEHGNRSLDQLDRVGAQLEPTLVELRNLCSVLTRLLTEFQADYHAVKTALGEKR